MDADERFLPESMCQWITEDQAFFPSYDLAPPSRQYCIARREHTERPRKRDNLLMGEGVGEGEGAKSYDGEKPSPLYYIQ
jgi:hypothetical protein